MDIYDLDGKEISIQQYANSKVSHISSIKSVLLHLFILRGFFSMMRLDFEKFVLSIIILE